MAYDLDNFCDDCREALATQEGEEARETIRQDLEPVWTGLSPGATGSMNTDTAARPSV